MSTANNATAEILIVEDEQRISRFLSLELEHEGYRAECVADGREALEAALKKDYDLIVLDVMLPSLNGIEVLRRLRQSKDTTDRRFGRWNMCLPAYRKALFRAICKTTMTEQ